MLVNISGILTNIYYLAFYVVLICVFVVFEGVNPCSKNPCQNIAAAHVDSCVDISHSDFECSCQPEHSWDDDLNSCILSMFGT